MTEPAESYVLVHGAHHGSWLWDRLTPLLELPAFAVDLPGRNDPPVLRSLTVHDCAVAVAAQIRAAGLHRVIVVGHSLAGTIAYTVAAREPEMVVGLVGIAAVFPPPGRSALDLWPLGLRWVPRAALTFRPGGIDAPVAIDRRRARRRIANDLDDEDTAWLLDRLGPEAVGLSTTPVAPTRLAQDLRRTYVMCRRDQALSPGRQRRQARAIGADLVEIDSGHDPMLSAPSTLAATLDRLARPATAPTGPSGELQV